MDFSIERPTSVRVPLRSLPTAQQLTCSPSTAFLKFWTIQTRPASEVRALPWYKRWHHRLFVTFDFEHRKLPRIAKTLYEEMYTRLADGSIDTMRPRLCENIHASLVDRVQARGPNTKMEWTLHKYRSEPRVVSHRTSLMDRNVAAGHNKSLLQQAVLRVKSVQSLKRFKKVRQKDGKIVDVLDEGSVGGAEGQGRDVVEYFVVQRMTRKGKKGDWKVWGTTQETTIQMIEAQHRKARGLPVV